MMAEWYAIGERVEVTTDFVGSVYKEYWCAKRRMVIPDGDVEQGKCRTADTDKECKTCTGSIGRHATYPVIERGTQAVVQSEVEDNGFGDDTVLIRLSDGTTTRARVECLQRR